MIKKIRVIFPLFLTMLFLSLSGCTGATPVPEAPAEEPTEEAAPDFEPAHVDAAMDEVNYCLDCHADKDRLIETAKPVEAVVSENEGAG